MCDYSKKEKPLYYFSTFKVIFFLLFEHRASIFILLWTPEIMYPAIFNKPVSIRVGLRATGANDLFLFLILM